MDRLLPIFRRKGDQSLVLSDSQDALMVRRENRQKHYIPPKDAAKVKQAASEAVSHLRGNQTNPKHILGQFPIQFGQYRNETFKWLVENALGYVAHLVASTERELKNESLPKDANWLNKMALRRYVRLFDEGIEAIQIKSREKKPNIPPRKVAPVSQPPVIRDSFSDTEDAELYALAAKTEKDLQESQARSGSPVSTEQKGSKSAVKPDVSPSSSTREKPGKKMSKRSTCSAPTDSLRRMMFTEPKECHTVSSESVSAETLATSTEVEEQSEQARILGCATQSSVASQEPLIQTQLHEASNVQQATPPVPTTISMTNLDKHPIYAKWTHALPEQDIRWISKAFFTWAVDRRGQRAHMVIERISKMWWYPPEPSFQITSKPDIDNYFSHRLFIWMPQKLWHVRLSCPQPVCTDQTLNGAGVYNKVRRVVDLTGIYIVACENLQCRGCGKKVPAWNYNIISQLDVAKQQKFPAILTAMKACDLKVVRLLRERGLGNSTSQIQKKLVENHSEEWYNRTIEYLTDCKSVKNAATSGLVKTQQFADPPPMPPVPQHRWLMQVYIQDVLLRLEETKADITSVFGRILKMDSTKKIVSKLAGSVRGTGMWATNIGNEYGQVLMSVITAGEGHALAKMADGIMCRYSNAEKSPPQALYVDRDCCGRSPLRTLFHQWQEVPIRLDIWHFMRRLSVGCTTDSHPLYALFMARLSRCIFIWDKQDLDALKEAKQQELRSMNINLSSDEDVLQHISKSELALHCKRRTRGTEETTTLITSLIKGLDGASGNDNLGVPLINSELMWTLWEKQKKHVACIQDPDNINLYIQTGSVKKGNSRLPTYRCARGSTSLESFHLHLNRFIPGTLASDILYQAYLIEGLSRWNQDRASTAVGTSKGMPRTYSQLLRHTANSLGEAVLGRPIDEKYETPIKYTGELIGVDYLLSQTGEVLQYQSYIQTLAKEDSSEVHPDFQTDMDIQERITEEDSTELWTTAALQDDNVKSTQSAESASLRPILPLLTEQEEREMLEDIAPDKDQSEHDSAPVQREQSSTASHVVESEKTTSHTSNTSTTTTNTTDTATANKEDDSVGPDGLPGFGAVQNMASFLVDLHHGNLSLTAAQASDIIRLWEALSDYDKKKTVFPAKYDPVTRTKFRAPKKQVHPGVQSTECNTRAPNSIGAARPDCNRYVEGVVARLCDAFPGSRKRNGITYSRWNLIMEAYNKIRSTIMNNAKVRQSTQIQLPLLNQRTLQAWFNERNKRQNVEVLSQGLKLPEPQLASDKPIPAAIPLPTTLTSGNEKNLHNFVSPDNTSGTVEPKRKRPRNFSPLPTHVSQKLPVIVPAPTRPTAFPANLGPQPVIIMVPQITSQQPPVSSLPFESNVHYQTKRYQRKRKEEESKGIFKRKYVKQKSERNCKKCGEIITTEKHKNLWGSLFCANTATETFEEFKERRYRERFASKSSAPDN